MLGTMTLPNRDSLRDKSRDELIDLLLVLAERVERLEAELARLKRPATTSRNSSQPPSRDQKANAPKAKRRHHRGAKTGHAKATRPLTDKPDRIIEVRPSGVRRPWRKQGLARALIARSLSQLRELGMTEASLTVDTENPSGALRLYEGLGYRPVKRGSVYRKPLD